MDKDVDLSKIYKTVKERSVIYEHLGRDLILMERACIRSAKLCEDIMMEVRRKATEKLLD